MKLRKSKKKIVKLMENSIRTALNVIVKKLLKVNEN